MRSIDLFDHDGTGYLELCKVDEAGRFEYDDDAWDAWIGRIEKIQERSRNATDQSALEMAVSLLNNWRWPMACVMRGEEP